ncbi:ketosteroid isomerase-like protein [Sphingobium fontiphilum]|uniref:Ketosteroid isomerase-like protein n=1 Tax=Sphingobium fontiphilum TaxID=944425 RepID=A0A7W6DLI7_9SPHN|nr:nuclear transport factor 2 family protein [Sphingobium fontiphilum]MBB3982827.1 ketosteroid isomerase-like protein [Sphingobium fontiphilum]
MTGGALENLMAVARAWEDACRSGDNARIVDLLTDDAAVWYNFQPDVHHSKAGYRAILDASDKTFTKRTYTDMRLNFHPGGFVEQATLSGDTPQGQVEIPFLLVATVEGGRISRLAEYFDSTILHQAGLAPA